MSTVGATRENWTTSTCPDCGKKHRAQVQIPDVRAIGSALMNALLAAADVQEVPLVVLLGSPQYYGRFGFRPAVELGVVPPEPRWGSFQARPVRAYTPSVAGPFEYAPAFSS